MDGTYPETYFCIDQKSFYASVECVERQLDPMTALLVVADAERSKNTICLAVSVGCKKKGIKNRCRLGDIPPNMGVIVGIIFFPTSVGFAPIFFIWDNKALEVKKRTQSNLGAFSNY